MERGAADVDKIRSLEDLVNGVETGEGVNVQEFVQLSVVLLRQINQVSRKSSSQETHTN